LDHSIFLVGWGYDEDLQMPYWIVRNSYGDGWGMNGDFHVRRGNDDFGIESELTGY
jgi:cathepsin F